MSVIEANDDVLHQLQEISTKSQILKLILNKCNKYLLEVAQNRMHEIPILKGIQSVLIVDNKLNIQNLIDSNIFKIKFPNLSRFESECGMIDILDVIKPNIRQQWEIARYKPFDHEKLQTAATQTPDAEYLISEMIDFNSVKLLVVNLLDHFSNHLKWIENVNIFSLRKQLTFMSSHEMEFDAGELNGAMAKKNYTPLTNDDTDPPIDFESFMRNVDLEHNEEYQKLLQIRDPWHIFNKKMSDSSLFTPKFGKLLSEVFDLLKHPNIIAELCLFNRPEDKVKILPPPPLTQEEVSQMIKEVFLEQTVSIPCLRAIYSAPPEEKAQIATAADAATVTENVEVPRIYVSATLAMSLGDEFFMSRGSQIVMHEYVGHLKQRLQTKALSMAEEENEITDESQSKLTVARHMISFNRDDSSANLHDNDAIQISGQRSGDKTIPSNTNMSSTVATTSAAIADSKDTVAKESKSKHGLVSIASSDIKNKKENKLIIMEKTVVSNNTSADDSIDEKKDETTGSRKGAIKFSLELFKKEGGVKVEEDTVGASPTIASRLNENIFYAGVQADNVRINIFLFLSLFLCQKVLKKRFFGPQTASTVLSQNLTKIEKEIEKKVQREVKFYVIKPEGKKFYMKRDKTEDLWLIKDEYVWKIKNLPTYHKSNVVVENFYLSRSRGAPQNPLSLCAFNPFYHG